MKRAVSSYGESGAWIDLDCARADDRARRTQAIAAAARATWPHADVVLGGGSVAVFGVAAEVVASAPLDEALPPPRAPREHVLRAVYDGPDLAEVAATLGISTTELVARHTSSEHVVELLGFLPGFAYLSSPSFAVSIPRRASPRPRVPSGSLAVAASFTGVYPFASPGGWNLLGRVVGATMFDPERDPPSLLEASDLVRFVAVDAHAGGGPEPRRDEVGARLATSGLLVLRAPALATVQDLGRRGQLGRGISLSGALDEETLRAANTAVANDEGAAAIEIPLGALEIEARGAKGQVVVVSVDGEPPLTLNDGERLRVEEGASAVRYLAVRGGVDVPVVLGSRSTCVACRFGGFAGRPLRRGDMLPMGAGPSPSGLVERRRTEARASIAIAPGPHLARFPAGAYEELLRGPWRITARGDRTGARLEGSTISRDGPDLALPFPMVRGAVQITTDGTPIVLGPDHPTTGGYPVLAVVHAASLAPMARLRPGAEVRFVDSSEAWVAWMRRAP